MRFLIGLLFSLNAFAAPSPVIWGSPYANFLTKGLKFSGSDTATTCVAGLAGSIRYNAGTMEACNGSAWSALGAGAATAVSATDGLVGTPSISFSADPDTGFYRIGTDSLGITAGGVLGVEVKNIGSSNVNVGIGSAAGATSATPFTSNRTSNAAVF